MPNVSVYFCIAVFALLMPRWPQAQEPPPASSSVPETLCQQADVAQAAYFPQLRLDSIGVRRVLCIDGGTQDQVLNALVAFIKQHADQRWFAPFGGFENGADPLSDILQLLNDPEARPPSIGLGFEDALTVNDAIYRPAAPDQCSVAARGNPCGDVLDEFVYLYAYAHNTVASAGALAFAKQARALSSEWDRYLAESRGQTPLELVVNSALFRRDEGLQFSGPPNRQWIILHPNLVIENVDDALDGENTQEALMIELAGVDWWRQDRWYVPSGGSLVAIYSDRAVLDDVGYGVVFHFKSVYSIGFTRRDSSNGIFISFDLLKFLQNRQSVIERYAP